MNIEEEIQKIKDRNKKVELDKKWETSVFRKVFIAIITYIVIALFFYSADLSQPLINAIVPTMGFLLSTLSISFFKKVWINHICKKTF